MTIRKEYLGKMELRLVARGKQFFGLADGKIIAEGDDKSGVWQELFRNCGQANSQYFGFDSAKIKFLKYFPDGFQSELFTTYERDYKVRAKEKLDKVAPLENALTQTGLAEAVLSAYQPTNLLSHFEKIRVREVLRSDKADDFIQSSAQFAAGDMQKSLYNMERILKSFDAAKWAVITYLPFLWRPQAHMYLKPTVTRDFAERVGHPFAQIYEARLNFEVYASFLDLTAQAERELIDLNPKDRIDIQSFIWVIGGSYDDKELFPEFHGEGR